MRFIINSLFAEAGITLDINTKVWEKIVEALNIELRGSCIDDQRILSGTISTREGQENLVIQGPTLFDEGNEINYTIWLPYEPIKASDDYLDSYLFFLFKGIQTIFEKQGINLKFKELFKSLRDDILGDSSYQPKHKGNGYNLSEILKEMNERREKGLL